MPLILILLALLVPRITILLLWLMTDWLNGLFQTLLWPIVGFIFLPLTFLWYAAVQHWFGGQWTLVPIIGLIIAVLVDISPAKPRRREVLA
jgi:hypothetical protein